MKSFLKVRADPEWCLILPDTNKPRNWKEHWERSFQMKQSTEKYKSCTPTREAYMTISAPRICIRPSNNENLYISTWLCPFPTVQSSCWSCLLCCMLVIKCVAAQGMHGLRPRTYPTTSSCRAIFKDQVFICLVISCEWWWWWWWWWLQWWYVLALRRFTHTP